MFHCIAHTLANGRHLSSLASASLRSLHIQLPALQASNIIFELEDP